jgi:hypothetical protein
MNITKKAGRGKVQHLFVLPGHLEILQFATTNSKSKRRSSQASQVSQISQPDLDVDGEDNNDADNKQASQTATTDAPAITATEFDPFASPDCFGSVTDLGTGYPVVFINVPEKNGRIKLTGTILNPKAPLMVLQLPANKTNGGSVSCDSTFSSIIVFNQISWVEETEGEDENEEKEKEGSSSSSSSSASSSSSSSPQPKKKQKKQKKLPELDDAALGEIQTKFDLRSFIKKDCMGHGDVIVVE